MKSDNDIIELLEKDRRKGFEAIVSRYSKRLYWHIRRLVLTHEDADDTLQNSFIKCWKGIKDFKGESSLYTWLYSIATNEALMVLRRRRSMSETSIEDIGEWFDISAEGDFWFDGDEAAEALQNAILTLPDKQRTVFLLRYYEELSYDDISAITGTSTGALKASYHHAVKKIEKIISS